MVAFESPLWQLSMEPPVCEREKEREDVARCLCVGLAVTVRPKPTPPVLFVSSASHSTYAGVLLCAGVLGSSCLVGAPLPSLSVCLLNLKSCMGRRLQRDVGDVAGGLKRSYGQEKEGLFRLADYTKERLHRIVCNERRLAGWLAGWECCCCRWAAPANLVDSASSYTLVSKIKPFAFRIDFCVLVC